jgi:hypothetical protein
MLRNYYFLCKLTFKFPCVYVEGDYADINVYENNKIYVDFVMKHELIIWWLAKMSIWSFEKIF